MVVILALKEPSTPPRHTIPRAESSDDVDKGTLTWSDSLLDDPVSFSTDSTFSDGDSDGDGDGILEGESAKLHDVECLAEPYHDARCLARCLAHHLSAGT